VAEERVERRLAAILAADVAGYSRMMGADEIGTLTALKTHRRELIDPKIAEHHGRIVKTTGDGLLVEFASVVEAVRCAVEVNEAMAKRNADVPFTYRGRAVDVKQVGRELGVRYVLEGSVRKAANRLRIAGQLIDASSGAHLWADRFEGQPEDIFDLQDQVTANVVGAIAPKLEQAEIERALRKPTQSLDAYDYFLRGMAGIHSWTWEANKGALTDFYRVIELDPNFASAYGLAARCYLQRKSSGWVTDRVGETAEVDRLARRAGSRAQSEPRMGVAFQRLDQGVARRAGGCN
jgi:hypothetical protein